MAVGGRKPPPHDWILGAIVTCWMLCLNSAVLAAAPLAELEYRITGLRLRVSPSAVAVPKGIAGSVAVDIVAGEDERNEATRALAEGAHIEAILRGPSFPARKILGLPDQALLLPVLNLVGDYQLDDIKLVDSATGEIRLEGTPSSVPVRVFDELLVSRVTSRPLTSQEIEEKGIVIDESNFRAVEFEVGFVVDGATIPVKFPVVAPSFVAATEVIPQAELEERLAEAERVNNQIAAVTELPPELEVTGLNIQIKGINFQFVDVGEDPDLALQIPPIPAVMVIPGNIGFLNQFFSVQIFTENAAPQNSGLSVRNLHGELVLPVGPDLVPGTYDLPGDDPLRFARVGEDAEIHSTVSIIQPGPDGEAGTADDIGRLQPGEAGQGEFLVEGLREGLHVMDVNLTGTLDGLAAGPVDITGSAAGSVLVRNPNFSLAFSHPRTIRAGEPYEASVTILNTSEVVANLASVSLPSTSISGARLDSEEKVFLGDIAPGETKTAVYRLTAQRTGSITFSQLTSDSDIQGVFRLRMGVDERGVALSPDAIGYPEFVDDLPPALLAAANRVLGQALSIATAGQLPPGVQRVSKSTITRRVIELAEAGQRVRYGDPLERVLADLLLDWQGARRFNAGFDQIMRETDAGREFREVLMTEWESADGLDGIQRLGARADDLAGRGDAWWIAATDHSALEPMLLHDDGIAGLDASELAASLGYRGGAGHWLVAPPVDGGLLRVDAVGAAAAARIRVLNLSTNGTGTLWTWSLTGAPAGACYTYDIASDSGMLDVDEDCDGVVDSVVGGIPTDVVELAPDVIAVIQDISVNAGRPDPSCLPPFEYKNYGTVLAVLFSKPMIQEDINQPGLYALSNGITANSVRIQPGGRVALLNLQSAVGTLHARDITIREVTDPRGGVLVEKTLPVQTTASEGASVRGRVARADGSPAPGVPVTLTYYDQVMTALDCRKFVVRVSQAVTDEDGYFSYDFVMAGVPYSVSATDTAGLSQEAIDLVLEAAAGDAFARERLQELASDPAAAGTLLEAFAVGTLPEAVAVAEGLDRALVRDLIEVNSARVGTDVVLALRFRGRGTVRGTVLNGAGSAPAPGAAVNLFPDPTSRELGRGLFADNNGEFAFFGIPLGVYTVEAVDSTGRRRTVSGSLEQVGQIDDLEILLSTTQVELTGLQGRVFEADGVTPHGNAPVFVGRYINGIFRDVVAAVDANGEGQWTATGIPVGTWDVVALSFDGKRKGERRDVAASSGVNNQVNLTLQGRAIVQGRVEFANGVVVPNAIVAGGDALARADATGAFTLTGVPIGPGRTISAGVERNPAAGIDFPRIGSAQLDVVPGNENFVVVRLASKGTISGRVFDTQGNPVPNIRVAIPRPADSGFLWVDADANGNYVFENLGLGAYTVSAPAPLAGPSTDVTGILNVLREQDATEDEIRAALGEAFAIFTGSADPLVTGEGGAFNPLTWGYGKTALSFDGQSRVVDIRFLPEGTISGTVLNGQEVPIGARVRLTGIGPTVLGDVGFIIRGERNSDPALGTFEFPGQALAGPWGLQAASPFYPVVISEDGVTFPESPDVSGVILQFPEAQEVNGRLTGTVLMPNGQPAGDTVEVRISFGDLTIHTDSNGVFDTQIDLPAITSSGGRITYTIEAEDLDTGLRGTANALMTPGATTDVSVILLDKGNLHIAVVQADGSPAPDAIVQVEGGSFPFESFAGTTGAGGALDLFNLFEGRYSVCARFVTGATTIAGRSGVTVLAGQTNAVTVQLAPTGTIRGRFLEEDRQTPIPFAQIAVGNIGFATTGDDGTFEIADIPLGGYRLVATDPVHGRLATATVNLGFDGEIKVVDLVVQPLGEVTGTVINSLRTGTVPGASVTLTVFDGITPARTVTTGPDGRFAFPGTPAGGFSLLAIHPVTKVRGSAAGTLPEDAEVFTIDIELAPSGSIAGTVLGADGSTPQTNATVTLNKVSIDTDADGRVAFDGLALKTYAVRAQSLEPGATRNASQISVALTEVGPAPEFTIALNGIGSVAGAVVASDGVTPVVGAEVKLYIQAPLFPGVVDTALSDGTGGFRFDNVPVGPFRLTGRDGALAASANGELTAHGEVANVDLRLGDSGRVIGRLVEADGATPVTEAAVSIAFIPPSGLLGRAADITDPTGVFAFEEIPVGAFDLEAIVPALNGIARLTAQVDSNNQVVDVGDVVLDQEEPAVESVVPADTATGVSISTDVVLSFSEALDPARIDPNAIYLRSDTDGLVPAAVDLLGDSNGVERIIHLQPDAPLTSEQTYEVVVIAGDRINATGSVVARGPVDRVGRALTTPFVSSFTTRDDDPPVILSFEPADGRVQVDPSAVVRLSFNEAIQSTGLTLTVEGDTGPVPGSVAVGVNNLVLVFTPDQPLPVNQAFTATVDGIRDIAGNAATGLPRSVSYATLDTLGPEIAELRIRGGADPLAGAAIDIEAVLAEPESNVVVRMSADLVPFGETAPGVRVLPYRLPASGMVTLRAVAIDRYGNEGQVAELPVTVLSNQPPQVAFTRVSPVSGPVNSGSFLIVDVSATDDGEIAELKAAMSGAVEVPLITSTGDTIRLQGVVFPESGPDAVIQILAEATDTSGESSGQQLFQVGVGDGTRPETTLLSPAPGTEFLPGDTVSVEVESRDNFGVDAVTLAISGVITGEVVQSVSPPETIRVQTLAFTIPADTAADGSAIHLSVTSLDTTGLVSSAVAVSIRLRDLLPPEVISMTPADGATGVSVIPALEAVFSEPMDSNSISQSSVTLEAVPGGTNVALAVTLLADGVTLEATPAAPLETDAQYRFALGTAITDRAGNALTGEVSAVFGTGAFGFVTPVTGDRAIEGQTIRLLSESREPIGIASVRYLTDTGVVAVVDAEPYDASYTIPDLVTLGSNVLILTAEAVDAGGSILATATAELGIEPLSGDADGDGIDNATELAVGTDPFVDDTAGDLDNDGVTNLDEINQGTDPLRADTDGDGSDDGNDPNPLVPNAPPQAGERRPQAALSFPNPDDSASIPNRLILGQEQATIEMWFRTDDANGIHHLFYAGANGDGLGGNNEVHVHIQDGRLGLYCSFGGSTRWSLSGGVVEPGRVHHAAATWDRTADRVLLYLDGNQVDEGTYDIGFNVVQFNNDVRFGRHTGSTSPERGFVGIMGEMRVWQVARTQVDIRQDMQRVLNGDEAGLRVYTRAHEGAGDQAFDHTRNRDAAILNGTSAWAPNALTMIANPSTTVVAGQRVVIVLPASDADGEEPVRIVTSLPSHGTVFQVSEDGSAGSAILAAPAEVLDSAGRVMYEADGGSAGPDPFGYVAEDDQEASAEAMMHVRVVPGGTPPTAVPDVLSGFEDNALEISTLADNDVDPDGDPVAIVATTPPAHGTLNRNEDGSLTYLPDPGFQGTDTFVYAAADGLFWDRSEDFDEGTAVGRFAGNPNTDRFGYPAWQYEYVRGTELGSPTPWYSGYGAKMLWDNSWFGAGGAWSRDNDLNPPVDVGLMTHTISSEDSWRHIPVVRWISPLDDLGVHVLGELRVRWSGSGGVGSPVDVDVAVVHRDRATGTLTPLLTTTVSKPTPGPSIGDEVVIPVHLTDVNADAGDELVITHRARNAISTSGWITLSDNLAIVPAGTNLATVSVEVVANSTPTIDCPPAGTALAFSGSGSYINIPGMPNPTNAVTAALWARSDSKLWNQHGVLMSKVDAFIIHPRLDSKRIQFYIKDGGQWFLTSFTPEIDLTQWHHYAGTYDGQTIRLFIDGFEVASTPHVGQIDLQTQGMLIGADGHVSNRFFDGDIDEATVWDVALNGEEIRGFMRTSLTGQEPGLFGYWNFDQGSGTQAFDLGPNAFHGSFQASPTWIESPTPFTEAVTTEEDTDVILTLSGRDDDADALTTRINRLAENGVLYQVAADGMSRGGQVNFGPGTALAFDGVNDVVQVGNDPRLIMSNAFTFAAWIYPTGPGSSDPNGGILINKEGEYEFARRTNGEIEWALANVDPWDWVRTGFVAPLDAWSHIAIVFDGTTVTTYGNGVLVGQQASAGDIVDQHPGSDDFRIGGRQLADQHFAGRMDDVEIWNVARDAAQVAAGFNQAPTGAEPGLVGYWRFNDGEGNAVTDSSANGIHGIRGIGEAGTAPVWVPSDAPIASEALLVADPQGRVVYAPRADYTGPDFIGYTVSDGKVESDPCRLAVLVSPVNDTPVANPDVVLTLRDVDVVTGDVLANDTDADGDALTVFDFTQPTNGTVAYNGDGTFFYSPDPGYVGEDPFTYRVTDGITNSAPGSVTVTVDPATNFHWIATNGGNWGTAVNWDRNALPGPDDKAFIDADGDYTVTLNVDVDVSQLFVGGGTGTQTLSQASRTLTLRDVSTVRSNGVFLMTGGNLSATDELRVGGSFEWNGGSLLPGTELVNDGLLLIGGGDDSKRLNGARIHNRGTAIWQSSSRILVAESSRIVNEAGSEFEIRTDQRMEHWFGVESTFENHGTLRKTAGTGPTRLDMALTGDGLVLVESGVLRLTHGGSLAGEIRTVAGTQLYFSGGTFQLTGDSLIAGEGSTRLDSGIVNLSGDWINTGALLLQGGTFNVLSNVVIAEISGGSSGNLGGSGMATVTGPMVMNGLHLLGSVEIITGGPLTITGSTDNNRMQGGATLRIRGGAVWDSSNRMLVAEASRIINEAGSEFEIRSDQPMEHWFGANSTFENHGMLRKTGGTGETRLDMVFTDDGMVSVESGVLRMTRGGTVDGELGTTADGQLYFNGGIFQLTGDSLVAGEGSVRQDKDTVNLSGDWTNTGALLLQGGTFNVLTNVVFAEVTGGPNGSLGGSGQATVTGPMVMNGLRLLSSVEIITGGPLTITGSTDNNRMQGGATLRIRGGAVWDASTRILVAESSRMINEAGSEFEIRSDQRMEHWFGANSAFENHGMLRKTGGTGETRLDMVFTGDGMVSVESGVLRMTQGGTVDGELRTTADGQLYFNGGIFQLTGDSLVAGEGSVRQDKDTVNLSGAWAYTGALLLQGGSFNVLTNVVIAEITGGPNGTLGGSGQATVTGPMVMNGLRLLSSVEIITGGPLTITGSTDNNRMQGGATLRILGGAVWDASTRILVAESSQVINEAGSVFEIRSDQRMEHWFGGTSSIENHGTLRKSAGSGTSRVDMHLLNDGSVEALSGTLRFTQSYTQGSGETVVNGATIESTQAMNLQGGALRGDGDVNATVSSGGALEPGFDTGILEVAGDYAMGSTHVLVAHLNGPEPGTGYDQVQVAGAVTLNGSVDLQFTGAAPEVDDTFTILTGNGITGSLAVGTVSGNVDVDVQLETTTTSVVVRVTRVDVLPAGAPPGMITDIDATALPKSPELRSSQDPLSQIQLSWFDDPGQAYVIEVSTELVGWTTVPATVIEEPSGQYHTVIYFAETAGPRVFRYRRIAR